MGKLVELEKLDKAIKDGEIRFKTVKTNIESLDKEITILETLEDQLNQNVNCLKQKNIIAIATEFKKAKEDLIKTRIRMSALKNDRELLRKACKDVESLLNKTKKDLEKLQKSGDNNVLKGNFGRKNG